MDWTRRQKWWLNFWMGALQGLTTLSWGAFGLDAHYALIGAQVIAYVHFLLGLMLYGAPPKDGDSDAKVIPVVAGSAGMSNPHVGSGS